MKESLHSPIPGRVQSDCMEGSRGPRIRNEVNELDHGDGFAKETET